jgi:hypothetical protein
LTSLDKALCSDVVATLVLARSFPLDPVVQSLPAPILAQAACFASKGSLTDDLSLVTSVHGFRGHPEDEQDRQGVAERAGHPQHRRARGDLVQSFRRRGTAPVWSEVR